MVSSNWRGHSALSSAHPNIANALIGNHRLRLASDYRIKRIMHGDASSVIDALGGTSAVARLLSCPTSTVHSWRRIGIPASRLAHLKLAAEAAGKSFPGFDPASPYPLEAAR
jgi:hypothetical protein